MGFSLYHLRAGDTAAEVTEHNEVIMVMVEGKATITGAGQDWGIIGDRMNLFDMTAPHCLDLSNGTDWQATTGTDCLLAVCAAHEEGGHGLAALVLKESD